MKRVAHARRGALVLLAACALCSRFVAARPQAQASFDMVPECDPDYMEPVRCEKLLSFGGRNVSYCYAHDTAAYTILPCRNFTFPADDEARIAQASVFARVRNVQDVHVTGFVTYPYPRDTEQVSFALFGLSESLRVDQCSFLFRANATFNEFAPLALGLVELNIRDTDVNVTGGGLAAAGLVLRLTGKAQSAIRNLRMGVPTFDGDSPNGR